MIKYYQNYVVVPGVTHAMGIFTLACQPSTAL